VKRGQVLRINEKNYSINEVQKIILSATDNPESTDKGGPPPAGCFQGLKRGNRNRLRGLGLRPHEQGSAFRVSNAKDLPAGYFPSLYFENRASIPHSLEVVPAMSRSNFTPFVICGMKNRMIVE